MVSPWSREVSDSFSKILTWMRIQARFYLDYVGDLLSPGEATEVVAHELEEYVSVLSQLAEAIFISIDEAANDFPFSTLYDYLALCLENGIKTLGKAGIFLRRGEVPSNTDISYMVTYADIDKKEIPPLFVISVPTVVLSNPLNWPVLLHEIGHILAESGKNILLEMRAVRIADYAKHRQITKDDSIKPSNQRKSYLIELEADVIALQLGGPVFLFRLYDLFVQKLFVMPRKHPPWSIRASVLMDLLKRTNDFVLLATEFKGLISVIQDFANPPIVNNKVGDKTVTEFKQYTDILVSKSSRFRSGDINVAEYNECKARFKELKPAGGREREIITAAYFTMLSDGITLKQAEDGDATPKQLQEFGYLVGDCLRLARLRQLWNFAYHSAIKLTGGHS